MALEFGYFPVPNASDRDALLARTRLCEQLGYDLVAIQDHPYQRRYLETMTLIAFLAGATERIRFLPDVVHLPLRSPAMLAKQAASLDVLSGGRFELGLGAGGFAEASRAMGAPERSPGELVRALEEAIGIIRRFWSTPEEGIRHDGEFYRLAGVKAGPPPAHDIGIWIGAYGPRMLDLIGRAGDGWVPSAGRLTPDDLRSKQRALDQAAERAGRDPASIRRVLNVNGTITDGTQDAWLVGPVEHWVEQLSSLADDGFDTFVFWPKQDGEEQLRAFAEVMSALRI